MSLAFVKETTGDQWIPSQKTSNVENVSIWWHHDEILKPSQIIALQLWIWKSLKYYNSTIMSLK